MKRSLAILTALAAFCSASFAQDAQQIAADFAAEYLKAPERKTETARPQYWNISAVLDIGMNQTDLTNWAAGGFNNLSLLAGLDVKASYSKALFSWNNRLQLQYGFIWSEDKSNVLQKNNDRIYLESKVAFMTAKDSKWNWTAGYDFRSQFTDTWGKYVETAEGSGKYQPENLKSSFISPGYNNLAFGIEWRPNSWFDLNISPVTGSLTICQREDLRKSYGMPVISEEGEEVKYGPALFQFGASVKTNAKFSINDNLLYETQLVLFTDYLNKPFRHNRVNWDNKITWNIAKFFRISASTWLIYDPIVVIDGVASKIQFKEFIALNFSYSIGGKK